MNRIKKLRLKYGLTASELGELVGVSYRSIYSWEKGYEFKISELIKLCEVFNCSTDYLLGISNTYLEKDIESSTHKNLREVFSKIRL